MRRLFGTFGVPREISHDGGPEFIALETKDFFERWGVKDRLSSAYHPVSNGRAEAGVKSMKRLLRENIGPGGSLDNDRFLRALLTHRNTPDPLSKKSPAEVLFGRKLCDTLPVFGENRTPFSDENVLPLWREGWQLKERALRSRAVKNVEALSKRSRDLPALRDGDKVFIQNQTGNHPKKWDRTGTVTECLQHNQYSVKNDATGKVTLRNRQFLRKYVPTEKNVLLGIPATDTSINNESMLQPPHTKMPISNNIDEPEPNNCDEDHGIQHVDPIPIPHPPIGDEQVLRRSSRAKKQAQVYDASTGEFVDPLC